MSMGEFSIIDRYFSSLGPSSSVVGVGDDASLMNLPHGEQLVTSVDTLVENIHFPSFIAADAIAHRSLASNLSDMAAMGALPRWCLLSLSLAEHNEVWLSSFSKTLDALLTCYQVQLVGGDTVSSPVLSVSITMMGSVPKGQSLLRSGAKVGDDVYISGYLGDAALGLKYIQQHPEQHIEWAQRFLYPTPRVNLALKLRAYATSCIDISDGLLADIQHIASSSQCDIRLNVDSIIASNILKQFESDEVKRLELMLSGGDDYELCFTASREERDRIEVISQETQVPIHRIGKVVENNSNNPQVICVNQCNEKLDFNYKGYQHFEM
jgi:thiamine-monophosphate kinase